MSQLVLNYQNLSASPNETLMVYSDISNGISRIICDGNPLYSTSEYCIGAGYATYKGLELLGFGFLHPLEPVVPLTFWPVSATPNLIVESPYFQARGMHYHTEHPLELCEFLQGMGLNTSLNATDPSWATMIPEFQLVGQWLLATRQNRFEWLLLCTPEWEWFCGSDLRQQRIQQIIEILHNYSVLAGVDVPLAFIQ